MELKISKIQWKKVLAFALTLCMTISMVQLPVNAEETTEPNTTKYFCVSDLESYKQTATFFDAAADGSRDAIDVTPMEEEDKAYTVDPTKGYYDAKWFSFTPSEDGTYSFKGEKIENNEVDSYGALMEKDGEEYRYITKNDDGAGNRQFEIKSTLQKGKTYYLCAGYFNKGEVKYNVKVSKMKIKELAENESDTFSAEDTPKYYTFIPTESGYYNLKLSWDSDKSLYDRSYVVEDQNGEKVYDIDSSWNQSGYTAKYLFEQGKTYYFNMKYFMLTDVDDDEEVVSGNITISISKIPVEEIRENQPGSFKTGTDSTRFKITVNDTGWYYLKYSWDGEKDSANISNDFDIRNESNRRWEYLTATYGTSYFIYLEKEKTYFLNQDGYTVTYDDETEAPESVDISISKAEYSNINTSQNGIISSGKGEKLFIFTPDKTGYYNLGNQARILGNSIAEMKASIFVHICTPFLKNKNMFEKLLTI